MKRVTLKVYGRVDPKREDERRSRRTVIVRRPYAAPGVDVSPKDAAIENGKLTVTRWFSCDDLVGQINIKK